MNCTIDKLAYSGNGVCKINGKVCFVTFSCPGDQVTLRLTQQKKSYDIADINELLHSSPDRVEPACTIFGDCGGCNWQHINYQVQLEQKRLIFADALWRGARVESGLIGNIVASPVEFGYRSRVRFKVDAIGSNVKIGFFRQGSHSVVDAPNGCHVSTPVINEILSDFRSVLTGCTDAGLITEICIDTGEMGAVAIVYCNGRKQSVIKDLLIKQAAVLKSCTGLFIQSDKQSAPEKIWGSDGIMYSMPAHIPTLPQLILSYLPGGFSQVNQRQNAALLYEIRRLAAFDRKDRLLDLYCGNGNFSLPVAAQVESVLGIEGAKGAIVSANSNKLRNGVKNAQFHCEDVKKALRRMVKEGRSFDVVLLDPPRAGADQAVHDMVKLEPGKIIYVSCDPVTLARDLGLFSAHGYIVLESVPLDMFPHTYHIESVTLLIKV